jgi:hypothetical protein
MTSSTDTTVEDVIHSIEKLCRITQRIDFHKAMSGLESLNAAIEAEKRRQKAIDRIAWKAAAAQRHAKRGNWK